jgi:hypothetical protein
MIANRIMDYLEGERREVTDAHLRVFDREVNHSLRRNLGPDREGDGGPSNPRPSGAWYCQRRMFYDAQPDIEREPFGWRSHMAFTMGDYVEQLGVLLGRLAGIEWTYPNEEGEQPELSLERPWGTMTGHLDGGLRVDPHGVCVVDFKGLASYGYSEMEKAAADPKAPWWEKQRDGYVAQIRWYQMMLREAGHGTGELGYLVGVKKDTGHFCEVQVRWDEKENDRLVSTWMQAAEMIESGTLPDRPEWVAAVSGTGKLPDGGRGPFWELDTKKKPNGWRCSYCPYTLTCFPGYGVVPLRGGPMYRKARL